LVVLPLAGTRWSQGVAIRERFLFPGAAFFALDFCPDYHIFFDVLLIAVFAFPPETIFDLFDIEGRVQCMLNPTSF
jgi:hypothetical protein